MRKIIYTLILISILCFHVISAKGIENTMNNITPEEIIKLLDLKPLPNEGGFYKETYRCDEKIKEENLPSRYTSERNFGTAIFYLLTPDTCSKLHKS